MQGRDASSRHDNWDKPAKGVNPDRKSYVLQGKQELSTRPATSSHKKQLAKESQQRSERRMK